MRILGFISLFSVNANPYLNHFNIWAETFRIEFQSNDHYYSTLQKWINNNEYIDTINQEYRSYTLGHNQFSGMDTMDFAVYVNNKINNYSK